MGNLRRSSSLAAIAACAALLLLVAACGGGDKATATTSGALSSPASVATATATTGTTGGSSSVASPSAEASATATNAATTAATATTKATVATTPKPIATATETAGADASPTTSADEATATGSSDDPLANVKSINPEDLPNFTLAFSYDATNLSGEASTQVAMSIQQSAVDNYYLKFDTAGQVIEEWLVDGTSYANLDGTVQAMPEGTGVLFEPSTILTQVPLQDTAGLEKQGEEKVNGRNTTKYRLEGKNVGEFLASGGSGGNASDYTNGGGSLDIWVDNDLKIMIKANGDLTWTNPDGTDGEMKYNYEIKEIGSTPAVAAPQ